MSLTDIINPIERELVKLSSNISGPISDLNFLEKSLLFVELSILAYTNAKTATIWGRKIGFTNVSRISFCNDQAVTIFSNETDIVISFRGTYNLNNFLEDAEYQFVSDGTLPGYVHKGFLDDFIKLWPNIIPSLDSNKITWATGHSLGGSLAAIAAVRASRRDGPNLAGLFTFGQPRIGDHNYVTNLDTPTKRWVNYHDLVPHLPPHWMKFVHFGDELYITKNQKVLNTKFILSRTKRLISHIMSIFSYSISYHNIYKYRTAILNSIQESANGQR